jgi:GH24 family phage-related lysozyme (muramidase)
MTPYILCNAARDLVLRNEGLNQPGHWPGGDSGITIGYGYDLGYTTRALFRTHWSGLLPGPVLRRLSLTIGVTGMEADAVACRFRDVRIARADAEHVFLSSSVPRYWRMTCAVFPGVQTLPPLVQGALFSLVYNRGGSMLGDRRREMRAIRVAVTGGDLSEIARQLRLMKRLWVGVGLDGLIRRREDEARLVELA